MATRTALPEGIVTFVFTDIEGSTRWFRRLGDRFVHALDRHNELLREAWSAHRGHEVKSEGDGFFVAFADAGDAVRACVDAQRAVGAETWADDIDLRVRMGIHAGLAYPRGDDYVALAVHQTARVESAAHGGQILLSSRAAELVGPVDDAELRPLGLFRVRDFDEPLELFQVHAEGLGDGFPAVRAVPADRHNLSRPPTSFVGRAGQLADLTELVGPGRLVTVVGPGGVGKTRLVTEMGLEVASGWRDGVWFVDLSPIDDASLVPAAIAAAIGASVPADAEAWSAVLTHLRDRRVLVILDTAEHLSDALVPRIGELLTTCPEIAVLATSRVPLGIGGERLCRLDPLATSDDGVNPAAVELFAERASDVDQAFRLDDTTLPAVTAICAGVDGLPLAIELAAARVGVLTLEEIQAGLEDQFRFLRSRDRSIPERQRTLDASLAWSARLLEPAERDLLARLGVFVGSFGLLEATAVADPADAGEAPELVWNLADSSLVSVDRSSGATRYRLLGSVQAYARRALEADHELVPTAERLGRWFVERFFEDKRFRRDRLAEMPTAIDNMRGILPVIADTHQESAQWIASAIADQHVLFTRFNTGAEEMHDHVARLTAPTQARVYLLVVYADLLLWSGDPDGAGRTLDDAEALRAQVGTPSDGTDWSIAYDRADLARRAGGPEAAIEIVERTLATEPGDAGRSRMLNLLGVIRYELGDIEGAYDAFEEGLQVDRRVQHDQNVAIAHANLAETAVILGRRGQAAEHALACLRRSGELGMSATLGMAMASAAHLSAEGGDDPTAVLLATKATDVFEMTGFEPAAEEQGPTLGSVLVVARERLGDAAVTREQERARAMALPDAIALTDERLTSIVAEVGSSKEV